MCGITGISINENSSLFDDLEGNLGIMLDQSLSLLNHRGPDDSGTFITDNNLVGLGHTRLSIIDLSSNGQQPMLSKCKNLVITFNGEIYNYKGLREALIAKGHSFFSTSDTEVLLALYLEMGEEMLSELNGIFSFAIWDKRDHTLFIARDHLGIKPLYYLCNDNYFIFSSEIKSLVPYFQEKMLPDFQNLMKYLSFIWSPGKGTPYKGVLKLEPGSCLKVKNGSILYKYDWYKLPAPSQKKNRQNSVSKNQLASEIRDAVHRQMISDVPLGSFLSGGLDSSSVVAFAKEINPNIQCFTIDSGGSAEGMIDDLPYAIKVADHLKVPLEIIKVESEDLSRGLEEMVIQLDEPLADPAPLNVSYICRRARELEIKVLLSGAGGDDIFTGYRRHQAIKIQALLGLFPKKFLKKVELYSKNLNSNIPFNRRFRKFFDGSSLENSERIINYFRWHNTQDLLPLLTTNFRKEINISNLDEEFTKTLEKFSNVKSNIDKMLILEQKFFLPDHNLTYTDKMSMKEGIEVRVPLLDINLVNYVSKIHNSHKQTLRSGKHIFKKSMEPFLPKDVIYRPKTGFGAPLRGWIKNELRDLLEELLNEKSIKRRGWFDAKEVRNLIERNNKGEIDASYLILSLMSIEIWSRHFLDKNSSNI
jgi:asparagine synthase (glutamine-hydrolysing)